MKLLIDANISYRLKKYLQSYFTEVVHIDFCELSVPAKDKDIWNFARDNEFSILTNDEDFIEYVNVYGYPPKVILLKTGNQSNNFILDVLIQKIIVIHEFIYSKDLGVLEIY